MAKVHGCVFFTRPVYTSAYTEAPNDALDCHYPIYTAEEDVGARFPEFFRCRLSGNPGICMAFATGRYRQQRGFVAQIGNRS